MSLNLSDQKELATVMALSLSTAQGAACAKALRSSPRNRKRAQVAGIERVRQNGTGEVGEVRRGQSRGAVGLTVGSGFILGVQGATGLQAVVRYAVF